MALTAPIAGSETARQAKGCFFEASPLRFARHSSLPFNARHAASAQASFPSRRAREKTVPEKDPGIS